MAIKISSFANAQPPTANYPSGDITDAAVGVNPTPVNSSTNGDMQQFFAKLLRDAGITPNGLRDNTTNGWQLSQALNIVTASQWTTDNITDLNGSTLTFESNKILIFTNVLAATNAVTLNGLSNAYPGNISIGGLTGTAGQTISFTAAYGGNINLLTGTNSLTLQYTGWVYFRIQNLGFNNFTVEVFNPSNIVASSTEVLSFGSGWTTASHPVIYTLDSNGFLSLAGTVYNPVSTSPAATIFTLPAGFRPVIPAIFSVPLFDGTTTTFTSIQITVDTSGNVTILGVVPTDLTCNISLDQINFRTIYY